MLCFHCFPHSIFGGLFVEYEYKNFPTDLTYLWRCCPWNREEEIRLEVDLDQGADPGHFFHFIEHFDFIEHFEKCFHCDGFPD